ncbi:MAG: energy-coupling factor transporter transmembrane protein EcfT [Aigarchaeota archaeon]|nr:energy-coupling factor transporter transmembrane protein EcfT [Aigarchaeota archaeon]MCX8193619.1 energy-coupling factor transporter transmembrane protein EcfT [Nitrososphaeria archaeon]
MHRLDPRVKLLISFLLMATTMMYIEVTVITIIIVVEAVLSAVARVFGRWSRTVYGASPLIVFVFLANFLFRISLPGHALSLQSIYESLQQAYRLIAFLASFSIFFLTTTPEELGMALTKMRVPYMYVFAFISAIRFTPILAEELQSIIDSQKSRGLELEKGNILTRLKRFIPILVPLMVNVLRRSYELAEAIEVKCFGAKKNRTYLRELKMKSKDWIALSLSIILFSLAIYFKYIYKINLP